MANNDPGQNWQAVIARSLAFLALHNSGLREKDLTTQGIFLEQLGLPRQDIAELLGTTPASLAVLFGRAKTKTGGSRGREKKK